MLNKEGNRDNLGVFGKCKKQINSKGHEGIGRYSREQRTETTSKITKFNLDTTLSQLSPHNCLCLRLSRIVCFRLQRQQPAHLTAV